MTDIKIANPNDNVNTVEFSDALTRNGISFGFDDGRVRDVCHSDQDPLWVLNVKKGVMSSFQQSLENFDSSVNVTETDVVGTCDTQYLASRSGWGKKFHKVKDMYSCKGNQALYQYALNLPDMNIQHLPVIK